jgi:hypothetical protein
MRPNRTRRLATALLFAPWLAACGFPMPEPAPMTVADVQIVDRTTGESLPIYGHRGQRWVAGVPGHRYAISVHNRSDGRLLAVMSVDGLNVVSGETAGWDQGGYVFAPGERYEVAGWRKSQERIAAFEFAPVPDSYAARTGRAQNVGVIGVALFREAVQPEPAVSPPPPPLEGRSDSRDRAEAPAAAKAAPGPAGAADSIARQSQERPGLGTAHGRSESSWVAFTQFERARSSPDEVITIRYDRRESLVAMGVIAPPAAAPNPFPSSAMGFVPDPPSR